MTVKGAGTPDSPSPPQPLPSSLSLPSSFSLSFLSPLWASLLSSFSVLVSLAFPFSLSPLLSPPFPCSFSSPSQDSTVFVHSQTFTRQLKGGASVWPVPLSVCPSPAGPRRLPGSQQMPGGRTHAEGPRERRLNPATTTPEAHTRAFAFCPKAPELLPPTAPRNAGKLKSQVWVWGATGEGSFGEDFLFCIFYDHI